jgi:hypothetical protein
MFVVAGLALSKLMPADPKLRIFRINNLIVFAFANAAFFSIVEIFLVKTPAFVWVYPWWGALPVFVTAYIPFFLISFLCYGWSPKVQRTFIHTLAAVDIFMLFIFAGVLHWI